MPARGNADGNVLIMLSIESNRAAQKYTAREQVQRILWMFGRVLFQLTPRPCFGLRRAILRGFGARIGHAVNTYPTTHIYFPWHLVVDDYASIGEWVLVYNLGTVRVGKAASVSHRAHLCAGTHDYRSADLPLIKLPINIGDNAWICADAFVGPGVNIGEGAVVGACAVVVSDIEPWAVYAGNPARFIKTRGMVPAGQPEAGEG